MLRLESAVATNGKTPRMLRSFVTSLEPRMAPREVLRLVREHWQIEHRRPDVRDVTLGEDASPVRSGAAPEGFAALRNAILGLLRQQGGTTSRAGPPAGRDHQR